MEKTVKKLRRAMVFALATLVLVGQSPWSTPAEEPAQPVSVLVLVG